MTQHILNPIFERTNIEDREDVGVGWFYPQKYFVSCSCSWQAWWRSKTECEDSWIEHMTDQLAP